MFNNNQIIFIVILVCTAIITHIPWFNFSTILFYFDWIHRSNLATSQLLNWWRSAWIIFFDMWSTNIQLFFNIFTWVWSLLWYDIGVKITFLIPIAILWFITPYILSHFITKNNVVAFLVSLFYGFNTYFIVRQTSHLPIAFIFSIAPLLIYYYLNFIKGKKNIQFILLFFLACGYEVRIVFILCFLLLIITCFHIKDVIKNIKTIFFSLLVILFLNLFWFLPSLMQSSEIADIAYRWLFWSHLFTLQHAFTLYDSSWTWWAPKPTEVQPINTEDTIQPVWWVIYHQPDEVNHDDQIPEYQFIPYETDHWYTESIIVNINEPLVVPEPSWWFIYHQPDEINHDDQVAEYQFIWQ